MTITPETFVTDVAMNRPAAMKVFDRYGIDFCCGGRQPLGRACETAGVPVERVIDEIEAAGPRAPAGLENWNDAPLARLVRHISDVYHAPQAGELQRLNAMMNKVEQVHAAHWPELVTPLARTVRSLTHELLFHTNEEEDRLFPAIVALEHGEHVALHGRALDRFLERLEDEHFTVGRLLDRLRDLTDGFVAPQGACNTFRGLYDGLEELSGTLKEHVHLENHVLFPRAAALGRARADAIAESCS